MRQSSDRHAHATVVFRGGSGGCARKTARLGQNLSPFLSTPLRHWEGGPHREPFSDTYRFT